MAEEASGLVCFIPWQQPVSVGSCIVDACLWDPHTCACKALCLMLEYRCDAQVFLKNPAGSGNRFRVSGRGWEGKIGQVSICLWLLLMGVGKLLHNDVY